MGWMILLMTEKKMVGEKWGTGNAAESGDCPGQRPGSRAKPSTIDGCRYCRFLNTSGEKAECICDERVNVYRNGELSDHRPYACPFRYYTDVSPITDRFDGMTKEETKGWFEGAAAEHENYKRLEKERDEYVGSEAYRRSHNDER